MLVLHNNKPSRKRPAGTLLLVACLAALGTYGCGKPSFEGSTTETTVRSEVSSEVSSVTDDAVQKVTEELIKDVQAKNFKKVTSSFSPFLRKQMPANVFEETVTTGFLKPLATGTNFRYEPVQVNTKANKATVRFVFDTGEQKDWHMNLLFVKVDSHWKVDRIFPPAKSGKPTMSGGAISSQK